MRDTCGRRRPGLGIIRTLTKPPKERGTDAPSRVLTAIYAATALSLRSAQTCQSVWITPHTLHADDTLPGRLWRRCDNKQPAADRSTVQGLP
jgi:hypothetical protein